MESAKLAQTIAKIADDMKAKRVVALDIGGMSDLCDSIIICSGSNDRQTKAIADAIQATLKKEYGINPTAVEGKQMGHWILMDYTDTIVHIFYDYVRDYYALERLWPKAKPISF